LFASLLCCFMWKLGLACPVGYWQWNENCYYFSYKPIQWSQSEAFCTNGDVSGHLASIENAAEFDFLQGKIADIGVSSFDNVWIGGNDRANDKIWQWSDGKSFNYGNTKWQPDYPKNDSNQCVAMDKITGLFRNENCQEQAKAFVCKFLRNADNSTNLLPTSTTCPTCKAGYEMHQGFCYRVFRKSMNWYGAEEACELEGGYLASIHNIQENMYIQGLILAQLPSGFDNCTTGPWLWIGLWDSQQTGNFMWTDNTSNAFLNWYPGYPKPACGAGINCAILLHGSRYNGLWVNRPCLTTRSDYYICKLSAQ